MASTSDRIDQAYWNGYQAALRDLAEAADRGGLANLIKWGHDNATKDDWTREVFHDLAKAAEATA